MIMHKTPMKGPISMMSRLLQTACLTVAVTVGGVGMTLADSASNYMSGAERIDVGDRIRMYSQRISAMACLLDAGQNEAAYRSTILQDIAEVDAMLAAMTEGGGAYDIGPAEEDRGMLQAIRGVELQWQTFRTAMVLRLDESASLSGPDYVSRQNLNLMHASKHLVSETINQYAIPPVLLQSDAYTLQIAARQRTLSQQIAKESCAVLTGNTVMGSRVRLTKSTVRFDASLQALINGFAGAGVSAPATPEIRDALVATAADWSAVRDQLLAIDTAEDHDQAADLFEDLNGIMLDFDALIPMYIATSKSGL